MKKLCGKSIGILILILTAFTAFLCISLLLIKKEYAKAVTGDGGIDSPYIIANAQDLLWLAENVNGGKNDGFYGTYFELSADIDLTSLYGDDFSEWTPIGNSIYPFKGNFDGCGFSVKGLQGSQSQEINGLFGYTNVNSVISNLNVYGNLEGLSYTAGIVGYNTGRIENCVNYASIVVVNDAVRVGGVSGYNCGEIVLCENKGAIKANLSTIIGGISGANSGVIEKSVNSGTVTTQSSIVGGVVGFNFGSASLTECINAAEISGKSTVGGIVGDNKASVEYNCNFAPINTINGTAGGLVGNNSAEGIVLHSFNVSSVEGYNDTAALCGYNQGIISSCFYNTDNFAGNGSNGVDISKCKGLTTLQMTQWDTLENSSVMGGIAEDNAEIWIKKDYDDKFCYYPQLKYFYDKNAQSSGALSSVSRICADESLIALSEDKFVYNNCEHKPQIYFDDYLLRDGYDYTADYFNNVDVGQATVDIRFINGFSGVISKHFEITPKEVFIEWDDKEFYYSGEIQFPTAQVVAGVLDEQFLNIEYITETAVCAGRYKVEAVLPDTATNKNYFISKSVLEYEIFRKPITVEWEDKAFVYNGEKQYPVIGMIKGNIIGQNILFEYELNENVNVGKYSVTAALKENSVNKNYFFEPETKEYSIEKKQIILDWKTEEFVYNGEVQYPKALIASGLVGGEIAEIAYCGYDNNVAANEQNGYSVKAYLIDDNPTNMNYTIRNAEIFYSIFKSPLVIEWWDTPLIYNGVGQAPGFYISSGRIGDDIPEFSISDYSLNIDASHGGKYKVIVSLAEKPINSNYSLILQERTYDIIKAEFDTSGVQFLDKCYFYDGNLKNIFIENVLPFGISVEYSGNGAAEIGEYDVTASLLFDGNNYKVFGKTIFSAKLKIAQANFDSLQYGINVKLTGTPMFGLNMSVSDSDKKAVSVKFDKTVLLYRKINFIGKDANYNEKLKVSVALTDKQLKKKGLYVVYYNSAGEAVKPEYSLSDGTIAFEAESITGFAIVCNRDFTLLIVLPIVAIALVAAVLSVVLILKNKKEKAFNVIQITTDVAENVAQPDNIPTLQIIDKLNEIQIDTSELTDKPFILDGVECVSYSCFLNSLKFKTVKKQIAICAGDEYSLKLFEAVSQNAIYWQGKKYRIGSKKYYELLNRAKQAITDKS